MRLYLVEFWLVYAHIWTKGEFKITLNEFDIKNNI
jgi:hypothetical protein